jgi:two-component system osmolarity sensor histidine kinase EnvZ
MQRIRNKLFKKYFPSKSRLFDLRNYIPRSLYGRYLLIVVVSALIVQLVSIYVFFYTHLDVISKHMARSVVAEMVFVKNSIDKPEYKLVLEDLSYSTGISFTIDKKQRLKKKKIADSEWQKRSIYKYIKPLIDPYNRFKSELNSHGLKPYEIYENNDDDNYITVKVQKRNNVISFEIPVKKITSSSSYVFAFWMVMIIVVTSLVSIVFFSNQIRSIRLLSDAAEKFGRGQNITNLKPTGSQEIRSLTISFIKMKERVMRQITQRTDMLSAVSHDLRTPLTRMKLQVEMMPESSETSDLKNDISDMEKLVNEYLDFARGDDKERANPVRIKKFLQENFVNYYLKMNRQISSRINFGDDVEVVIKKLALKRAVMNLVDNAFKFGENVEIEASLSQSNLIIHIDDDGPGIPPEERGNVFQPFYRIDSSRNLDKKSNSGGSGLGLAIVMDAITSHGGRIRLSDSPLGGLRVTIFIPV